MKFVFISRSEGIKMLQKENEHNYQQATHRDVTIVGKRCVEVLRVVPPLNQENYMRTTGAKLYFEKKCCCLSGYAWDGRDVDELIQKYKLTAFKDAKLEVRA